MEYKPLPIGIEDFDEMIEKGYYYVDKTLFLKELIDKKSKVNLFTRRAGSANRSALAWCKITLT